MNDEYKNIILKRIKVLLVKHNLTAEKLAYQSGVSKSGLSEILSGKKCPSSLTIIKLCSGFGILPKDFYDFKELEIYMEKI